MAYISYIYLNANLPTYGEISQPCEDNPEAYKLYHAYGNEENT